MTGSSEVEANLDSIERLVERAAARGCELVAFPENALFMGRETRKPEVAEPLDGPSLTRVRRAAAQAGIHVLLGSMPERSADPARPYNTSVLLDSAGEIAAKYRKIHLFDVEVAGDRAYRESDFVMAGEPSPVVGDVAGACVGLTVCFDLRFPWLYQALRAAGAQALFVPAAFTVPTGRDHWEVLLRARAIETQSFVLAPGQFGTHDTGRQTYGRSLIIDPWGTVVATAADGAELALAEIDLGRVEAIRARMPMKAARPA
jgi:predicted amidohydrolase